MLVASSQSLGPCFGQSTSGSELFSPFSMGHNLWLHFGVEEHSFATCFDVHQWYRVLTHSLLSVQASNVVQEVRGVRAGRTGGGGVRAAGGGVLEARLRRETVRGGAVQRVCHRDEPKIVGFPCVAF